MNIITINTIIGIIIMINISISLPGTHIESTLYRGKFTPPE